MAKLAGLFKDWYCEQQTFADWISGTLTRDLRAL
jgi:hypothetical protein